MRRLAARFSAFSRTDAGCFVLLCILVLLAHAPAVIFRASANPIILTSGLLTAYRRGVTAGYAWLDPNAGYQTQALGGYSADQWLHGHIPWWVPYMGVGAPLAGEMQGSSLFLPFVLLLHFSNGIILLKIVLQTIAGIATFTLLRQLGVNRLAAFSGAAIYELNGAFAWFAHAPFMPPAFLPLLLLGIERAFAKAGAKQRGGWTWIAVALAYSLYAGFPETAYLDGLLALVWAIYRFAASAPDARWAFAKKFVTGGVAGLLISAPIIVPFVESLQLSGVPREPWGSFGLPKISLAHFLMPYVFGPLHAFEPADPSGQLTKSWGYIGGYFSLTLFLLSITALFSGRRLRALRILLAIWIVIFGFRTLDAQWAKDLTNLLPMMGMTQVFRYIEPSCELAGAVLAALALDDWRRGIKKWPVLIGAAVSLVVAAIAISMSSSLIAQLFQHAPHYSKWFWGSLLWAFVITAASALLLFRGPGRKSARLITGLIVMNAFALFAMPELSGVRNAKIDLDVVHFLQHHIGLQRMYTFAPFGPNYGAYFHVASINHNAIPVPATWIHYIQRSLDPAIGGLLFVGFIPDPRSAREEALRVHLAGFEAAAVKYVLAQPGENPFGQGASVPGARLVYRGQVADVYELPHPAPYFDVQGGPCALSSSSRELLRASCKAPAVLIRRELYYPGWRAYVNGKREVIRADSIFQSINLPAGESRVSFAYSPSHIGLAFAAMIAGLLAIAFDLATRFRAATARERASHRNAAQPLSV